MTRFGYDEPQGIIIGREYSEGQLFYDNRPQGNKIYADTYEELKQKANEAITEYKNIYCPICLYSDDNKWELRVYEN